MVADRRALRALALAAGCLLATPLAAQTAAAQTSAEQAAPDPSGAGAEQIVIDAALRRDLSPTARDALDSLANPAVDDADQATRRKLVRQLLDEPSARPALEQLVDRKLAALERGYAATLDEPVRAAYHQRLRSLSAAELRQVAMTRRIWRNYILRPSTQLHFQQHFLIPATEVGELLLPDVTAIETKASKRQLRHMLEWNEYRNEVRTTLELGEDPTTGKLAPTGIAMPPLTQVRSYEEHLDHLQHTIALANSAAPREARTILLDNADKARFIDYEEAEFVLYANQIRGLMGVISWSTDVLACAATRDHSKDRVDGNASGHMSELPGKRGFTDRLRRFGTSASSEGAGGGANGRNYLHGLSYGGGHTGPLYSMKRNRVGVGRYGNCYTSTYGTDQGAIHPCQASTGELFMPPGIGLSDIEDPSLQDVYHALAFENYSGARELVQQASAKSKLDRFVRDYLAIAIEVEADWQLECLARVAATGDLYGVQLRLETIRAKFGDSLDKRLRPHEKRMATAAGARLMAAGRAYRVACAAKDRAAIEAITSDYADTVYASAARQYLADGAEGKDPHPLQWFLGVDGYLARFEYLTPE